MGGDQISKVVIEQDRKMHKYHFKYWGGDHWKCYHCNFRVDWSIRKARLHSKIHLNKGEEMVT